MSPIDDKSGSSPQPTTPPNPIISGVYQVGNGVSAPKLIYSVAPSFSKKARKKKIAGSCTVFLVVDQSGEPKHIHILKSVAEDLSAKQHSAALDLDEEVIKAVRQDRFEPATLEGKPVSVAMTIEVNFQIF
ncbi:MAG TPA: energy transducer TonB [Edaphobacter sp.]